MSSSARTGTFRHGRYAAARRLRGQAVVIHPSHGGEARAARQSIVRLSALRARHPQPLLPASAHTGRGPVELQGPQGNCN